MKRIIAPLFGVVMLLSGVASAEGKPASQRFYGKVVSVDAARRNVAVHNTRQKLDASFQWDEKTRVIQNKKPVSASDLKVGQSLVVSYIADANVNRATRITVRTPFKRAASAAKSAE